MDPPAILINEWTKEKQRKEISISWSPDKILYLVDENKTKCNRVGMGKKK